MGKSCYLKVILGCHKNITMALAKGKLIAISTLSAPVCHWLYAVYAVVLVVR